LKAVVVIVVVNECERKSNTNTPTKSG
jgi:hypothetical protein